MREFNATDRILVTGAAAFISSARLFPMPSAPLPAMRTLRSQPVWPAP
jgi:hypothetical protein